MESGSERRLAAILSADVVGYSRLMAQDEAGTIRTIGAYREQIAGLVREHRGRVVDTTGDNLLAEFPTALDAVECAVEMQRVLAARNAGLADDRRMEFRVGVHLGDVAAEGDRIYGDGVNLAARLEGLATPGGICVSESVRSEVRGKLGLGYRDLGAQEVKNIPEPVHAYAIELTDGPVAAQAASRGRPALWVALTVLALAVAGAALWNGNREPGSELPAISPSDPPSLAVLPFNNMSGDPEQEYFSDGITEDLITDLSQVSGLLVIARNSTFTYKGRAVNVADVGRELGVRYVLEGSVRKAGGRVRVNAQLVEASTGHHLWAQRYDRDLQDIFAVQDELTETIVAALEIQLMVPDEDRREAPPTQNLKAYDAYLRGISYLDTWEPKNVQRGKEQLARAVELDPEFGRARAALAQLYIAGWIAQWSQDPGDVERTLELAREATRLAPDDPETLTRASAAYQLAGSFDEALTTADRAIELNPNSAEAYRIRGMVLNHHGRPQAALESLEESYRRDPLDANGITHFQRAVSNALLGNRERALDLYRGCIQRNPDLIPCHLHLGVLYYSQGAEDEARAEFAEVRRLNPEFSIETFARRLPMKDDDAFDRIIEAWNALAPE